MKKFALKSLIFMLPFVACISIEYLLRLIPNDYSYKSDWLNKNIQSIEILNLGSSHTYYGINPKYFNYSCFNAAHVSQTPKYDYLILRKYICDADNLKVVIMPISYFTMTSSLDDETESWRVPNYTFYGFVNFPLSLGHLSLLYTNKNSFMKMIYRYYVKHKDNVNCDSLGWGVLSDNVIYQEDGKSRADFHTKKELPYSIIKKNFKYIENISSICDSKNIKLIFLTTPTCESYYNEFDSLQWNNTCKSIDSIMKNNNNSIWINLLKDRRFNYGDFQDSDHLNKEGSIKLSTLLNDTIIKLFPDISRTENY